MKKTTLTFTALPQRTTGTAGAGTLQLSVFIAPRLWTTESAEQILHLHEFPLFADWPAQVKNLHFDAVFAGGPTLPATPISALELRSELWAALFPPTISVKPFHFDNLANTPIQTIDTAYLEDWLHDLYRRIGTEAKYGAGKDKPRAEDMQNDPGLAQIARPSHPEPPYVPPAKRRVPIYYKPEEPEPEKGGCLKLLIDALNWITSKLGLGKPFNVPAPPVAAPPPSTTAGGPLPASASRSIPVEQGASLKRELDAEAPLPEAMAGATRGVSTAKAKFDEAVAFVKPFKELDAVPPPLTDAELADLLDFHDGVALAADYPTLLRALGLVVDLEIAWPTGLPASGMVSVKVGSLAGAYSYPLRTHYTLAGGRFLPAPRPVNEGQPETNAGLLRLSDENRYRVVQTDVVGAVIKVQNTATAIVAQGVSGLQTLPPPTEETLPALRSAGLAIVQRDLAIQLSATYVQAVGLNNALAGADGSPQVSILAGPQQPVSAQPVPTDELWAEDVTRGYRMDVRDLDSTSKKWRSLHQRTGSCRFTGVHPEIPFPVEDEDYVQLGTTETVAGDPKKVQRVPDVIATWTGWSLSAVRPGKSLEETDTPPDATKTAFKMQAVFKPVSGSLPRLRFGHRYQVRVRTVDLAGNSVFEPDDDPSSEFQEAHDDDTPPLAYRRFEPVLSPAVVLKAQPVEGESVERLVVRSGAEAGDAQHVNRKATERHIVPPKSSQELAEHHSLFDAAGRPDPNQATYDKAAAEANTLSHHWAKMGDKWALIPLPGVKTLPDADDKKDPTFWQTNDAFPLKYLPDPLARQAVFLNLPGPAENVVSSFPFNGDWPGRLPFRLKLKAIPAGATPKEPHWRPDPDEDQSDPAKRVLEVELAEGESRVVRLNSGTEKDDLPQLGVWDWETEPKTTNHDIIAADTAQGLNWLLMPYRELHLVHATQKPLAKPVLHITKIEKVVGDTAAAITGAADVHGKTTGKVDLLALWTDPVDDISEDAPRERKSRAALGEFNVTEPEVTSVPISANHNLGDTKYHSVTYVARGATRFREYMPAALLAKPNVDDLLSTPTEAEITAGSLNPAIVVVKDVKNSARPLAPAVAYVMPTLGRMQENVANTATEKVITRTRRGSGLRVFLQRPWYSSGAGELLGMVFKGQNFGTLSEALRPYVTEWANDPIWDSPAAELTPSAANFVQSAQAPQTVKLEETDVLVKVVGYPVEYDADRGLWFADVEFANLNAYTPMMRLALARFQPKSVEDCFISRVVRTDFIQPLPDRTLTIRRKKSGPPQFTVTLTGLAPTLDANRSWPVRAWIEKLEMPAQDDLGWRPVGNETVQLDPGATGASVLWQGTFSFSGILPPNVRYRLVIQETEAVGPAVIGEIGDTTIQAAQPAVSRTVYADMWEI